MRTAAILSTAVLVVALVVSVAAAPAWAHDESASALDLAPASSVVETALVVVLGAAIGLSRRRRIALALAVVLPLLGFEVGLHSVHHLDDQQKASQCVVASASTHLNGTPVDAPRPVAPIEYAPAPTPAPPDLAAPHRSLAPHEGRAPPIVRA
jgi:hypothetical protein